MLRLLLIDSMGMMEAITMGPDSVGKTFLEGQQLNSVCFDTATHEVNCGTCHLAVQTCKGTWGIALYD